MTDIHPAVKSERRFRGGVPPWWAEPRKLVPGFQDFLIRQLPPSKSMHPNLYASFWVLNNEKTEEGWDKIWIAWDTYQEQEQKAELQATAPVVAEEVYRPPVEFDLGSYMEEVNRRGTS